MITSDAHEGIQDAISKVFPDVPWQRCQFHFSKNISEKAPKKYQAGIRADLQEMWNCMDLSSARKKRDSIIADYKDVVIGVFPNEDSLLRLMGSVLLERNEVVSTQKAVFSPEIYQALMTSDAVSKLVKLAKEQIQLWTA